MCSFVCVFPSFAVPAVVPVRPSIPSVLVYACECVGVEFCMSGGESVVCVPVCGICVSSGSAGEWKSPPVPSCVCRGGNMSEDDENVFVLTLVPVVLLSPLGGVLPVTNEGISGMFWGICVSGYSGATNVVLSVSEKSSTPGTAMSCTATVPPFDLSPLLLLCSGAAVDAATTPENANEESADVYRVGPCVSTGEVCEGLDEERWKEAADEKDVGVCRRGRDARAAAEPPSSAGDVGARASAGYCGEKVPGDVDENVFVDDVSAGAASEFGVCEMECVCVCELFALLRLFVLLEFVPP